MLNIQNIAGYKFIPLNTNDLNRLEGDLLTLCRNNQLKGTILLSHEGVNISLAGEKGDITQFITQFLQDDRFDNMRFHHTYSDAIPFQRLKIKRKTEIVTMRQPKVDVCRQCAPSISPQLFKHWLDSKRDITILDTRNDYEFRFGSFENAINLHLNDFSEFPYSLEGICKSKPIVMFCTGGIRCEKASIFMLKHGFKEVYQLEGGILAYFAQVGNAHYRGDCFVFDERIALDSTLSKTNKLCCQECQSPIMLDDYNQRKQLCSHCSAIG